MLEHAFQSHLIALQSNQPRAVVAHIVRDGHANRDALAPIVRRVCGPSVEWAPQLQVFKLQVVE
ncbi:MAG: hypothetical protein JWM57_952 [Phycisphaerales bacterium]|nr:hypothetical protein [Phycisphaerales bacterium]